ncbi:hypothetical protein G7K_2908-t1 [Saitoella complicata NRRL Y-17804]|uniref:Vps72/YL1 C-terminal domain-containing protein n=2 Tax=Saitoella complicata (strain BCRC 22490 / CBS 7301 / JCM 7358 / NBRC 10748 / NRRL Y-17804) TaxID=698492 RepID=A0A0E9NFZ9_SAICN|nr:hypothetical protein G7K_2908-t1 [Saitoella complicata NRRL Y-17804]
MSDSSRSSSPEIDLPESLVAGRERRSNAGNRLRTLLDAEDVSHLPSLVTPDGEVLDESLLFGEDANDVEFASDMDVQEDVVESDFDDDDEEEVEDEEAVEKALIEEEKQQRRAGKRKATEAFIKPKKKAEPVKRRPGRPTKAEQAAAASETTTKITTTTTRRPTLLTSGSRRSARTTTAAVSTAVSAKLLALQARRARLPIQSRRSPTPELTQSERLAEAAITEEKNRASLGEWLRIEEERRRKREEMGRGQKRVLGAFVRVWRGGVRVDGFGRLVKAVTSEKKKEEEKEKENEELLGDAKAQKSKDTEKVTDPDATEDAAPPDSEMLDAPLVAEKITEEAAPSQSKETATEVAVPAASVAPADPTAVQMSPPTVTATPAAPSNATTTPAPPAPATPTAQAPQQPGVQATIPPPPTPTLVPQVPTVPTLQSQMPPPATPAPATPAVATPTPGGTPAPQVQPPTTTPTPAPAAPHPAHPPQAMWAPPGTPGAPPMQYSGWPPIPPCPPGVDPRQHHAYYVHYYSYAYPYHYPYHYPPPQQAAAAPGQVQGPPKVAVTPPPPAIDEEAERAKKKREERHDSTRTLIQLLDFPDSNPDAASILLSKSSTSPPPYPTKKMCPITGLDARYVDPSTGVPYRDVAAYRVLQAVKEGRGGWCKGIGAFTGGGRVAGGVPEGFE